MMRGLVIWVLLTLPAFAGMTVITLSDAAKARLDVLSFFLVAYFLLAWAVKGLWNGLAKSFEKMPRLSYPRALALMLLSGLFLYVILTMISGARELMTPGAWEKQGVGYRLRGDYLTTEDEADRKARLAELRDVLREYAEAHDGEPPKAIFSGEIPRKYWQLADGSYYGYLRPRVFGEGREVMVYETASAGPRRFVLMSDGSIEDWSEGKLGQRLDEIWQSDAK